MTTHFARLVFAQLILKYGIHQDGSIEACQTVGSRVVMITSLVRIIDYMSVLVFNSKL